jgi:hypothetical protein
MAPLALQETLQQARGWAALYVLAVLVVWLVTVSC